MKKKLFMALSIAAVGIALASCSKKNDDYELKVMCPSGAPLMAISGAFEKDDLNKTLFVVEAEELKIALAKNEEDIIVAPVNLGTSLYNAGNSKYKIASVITWGNTYFASQKENFQLSDMNNAEITLFGSTSINTGIAKYILNKKGIVPSNINFPDPDEVKYANQLLMTNPSSMVMTADPMLTVAKSKKPAITSYSISAEYKALTNHDYPQAAVFVKEEAYKAHKNKFTEFFGEVKDTCEKASSSPEEVAGKAIELGIDQTVAILAAAIPGCSIKYVKASDAKADLSFAAEEEGLKQYFGNKAPEDAFYLI